MYTNPNPKPSAITVKCGQRWPRLMELEAAAAYAGMTVGTFKRTFPGLIVQPFGRPVVVREQLDEAITNALEAFEARKAGKEAARA